MNVQDAALDALRALDGTVRSAVLSNGRLWNRAWLEKVE